MCRLKKRFDIEIKKIHSVDGLFVDENNDYMQNGMETYIFTKKYTVYVNFYFKNSYPFTPPDVYLTMLKKNNYIEFLCNMSCNFKVSGENCFCCSSLICKSNWGPQKSLLDILIEIKNNLNNCELQINKNIKKCIYLKHLGYDIH